MNDGTSHITLVTSFVAMLPRYSHFPLAVKHASLIAFGFVFSLLLNKRVVLRVSTSLATSDLLVVYQVYCLKATTKKISKRSCLDLKKIYNTPVRQKSRRGKSSKENRLAIWETTILWHDAKRDDNTNLLSCFPCG